MTDPNDQMAEWLPWLKAQARREARGGSIQSANPASTTEPPDFVAFPLEDAYRRGYWHGFSQAMGDFSAAADGDIPVTGDIPQNVNFALNSNVLRSFLDANSVACRGHHGRPSPLAVRHRQPRQSVHRFGRLLEMTVRAPAARQEAHGDVGGRPVTFLSYSGVVGACGAKHASN